MNLRIASRSVLVAVLSGTALVQGQQSQDPYAPTYTECPSDLTIRAASEGLSRRETLWKDARSEAVLNSMETYLNNANITGLDVGEYVQRLNTSTVPVVGLAISGGGTQSGIGGLGIWQAFDGRHPASVRAGTGGLGQILYYLTGLSGGGAVTVAILAANDFSTTEHILRTTNFSIDYETGPTGNDTEYFENIFQTVGSKAEQNFPVSVADVFGQWWGVWLPENATFMSWSHVARRGTAFESGQAPMPIVVLAEVIPGTSPEIGGLMYPGRNSTNGFDLTSYEVTPFKFGSWLGGRIQAFFPTEWLGTAVNNGTVQNRSECVQGFDQIGFIQGSTANAFTAYLIDDFYNIPVFAKRSLQGALETRQSDTGDVRIPPGQEDNPFVQLVGQVASVFNQTFNESLWATYPNPFENYNEAMEGVDELLLLDGSLTGETDPIRPLIVPDRDVDLIIVYEASSDAAYNWVNGTNLINSAQSAHEGNIPFPEIPDVQTIVGLGLNRQPTFFGCNASAGTPLVLYLPNSPWSAYANFTFYKSSFTDTQINATLGNAFELATYGQEEEWSACLACAAVNASLARVEMEIPDQCTQCFNMHCWNGKTIQDEVTSAAFDLKLRLQSDVSYREWNESIWNNQSAQVSTGGSSGTEDSSNDDTGASSTTFASQGTMGLVTVLTMMAMGFSLL
ncbi:lysophosphoplipase A [Stachybotrys elegans]|uniref:Lysophospholipase n=1 Tax=Stachybotrys elegans TaxID=80388 RepID=A0A8K0T3L8_9HYPO|nr:lysophosphoplipase A [Stachybotrys elegans]